MATVTELLKRKSDRMKERQIKIELDDITLTGDLLSLPHVLSIMDEYDTDTKKGAFEMALELIYLTFPIFRNKEMQEQNDHSEPHDIILDIFDVNEIMKISNELNKHYGVDGSEEVKK